MKLRRSLRVDADPTPLDFILQRPVFTLDEFRAAYKEMGRSRARASDTLAYHIKEGRLWSVRRGIYVHTTFVDPWLLASKLADDVVISHDGALSFHGLTGLGHRLSFMTTARTSVVRFNEVIYQPLRVEKARLRRGRREFEREGQRLFVTSPSVTLVDCLANLGRSPAPVNLMELFKKSVKSTDPDEMIDHALWFKSPLVVSRLAFFLTCTRNDLEPRQTNLLERHGVQAPTYFLRSARTRRDSIISRWSLIVSPDLHRSWPGNR